MDAGVVAVQVVIQLVARVTRAAVEIVRWYPQRLEGRTGIVEAGIGEHLETAHNCVLFIEEFHEIRGEVAILVTVVTVHTVPFHTQGCR